MKTSVSFSDCVNISDTLFSAQSNMGFETFASIYGTVWLHIVPEDNIHIIFANIKFDV